MKDEKLTSVHPTNTMQAIQRDQTPPDHRLQILQPLSRRHLPQYFFQFLDLESDGRVSETSMCTEGRGDRKPSLWEAEEEEAWMRLGLCL